MCRFDLQVWLEFIISEYWWKLRELNFLVFAIFLLLFQKLIEIICEPVIQICVQSAIQLITQCMLTFHRCANHDYIWSIYLLKKGHCLARVQNQKNFFVKILHVHFIEDFCEVLTMNNLCVLNFEKVLTTMPIHVDKYLHFFICLQPLGLREILLVPSSD